MAKYSPLHKLLFTKKAIRDLPEIKERWRCEKLTEIERNRKENDNFDKEKQAWRKERDNMWKHISDNNFHIRILEDPKKEIEAIRSLLADNQISIQDPPQRKRAMLQENNNRFRSRSRLPGQSTDTIEINPNYRSQIQKTGSREKPEGLKAARSYKVCERYQDPSQTPKEGSRTIGVYAQNGPKMLTKPFFYFINQQLIQ